MDIPSGLITIWNSTAASIPTGWVECDGNNGTPDLRDRFVVGAGGAFSVGDTGGSQTHDHDFTSDGHTHILEPAPPNELPSALGFQINYDNQAVSGTTGPANHDPPNFSLVFIMFL